MPVPSNILQALSEILAIHSPQVAARLKQRLVVALKTKGEDEFDERKFGFKGFRDFIQNGTQGLFQTTPTADGADIVVSLPGTSGGAHAVSGTASASDNPIRSEIWQAFTNPDAARVRFLNKRTYVVRHFLRDEDSPVAQEVAGATGEFVEIEPIAGSHQVEWMKSFIELKEISKPDREVLEAIVEKPYSSGVNAAFTGALRQHGKEWRQFRTRKVVERISAWANAHDVSTDRLSPRPQSNDGAPALPQSRNSGKLSFALTSSDGVKDAREQAARLLELLSNDEISRIVLPILLSTLLVRGKV